MSRDTRDLRVVQRLLRVLHTSDPAARSWGDQDDSGRNICSCFLADINSWPSPPVLLVCSGVDPL